MSSDTHLNYIQANGSLSYDSTNKAVTITKTTSGGSYIEYEPTGNNLNKYLGKTVKFECDIVDTPQSVTATVYQLVNGSYSNSSSDSATSGTLVVPKASVGGGFEISSNATRVRFRMEINNLSVNDVCKSKNWKIYVV